MCVLHAQADSRNPDISRVPFLKTLMVELEPSVCNIHINEKMNLERQMGKEHDARHCLHLLLCMSLFLGIFGDFLLEQKFKCKTRP